MNPRPRPAAPVPPAKPLGFLATFWRLRSNPITAFSAETYEQPMLAVRRAGVTSLLVNDPAAIEQVFVSNAANYRKSVQQQRRLQPALGEGLLTAEGETWRLARRLAAPVFNPRAIQLLYGDMQAAALALVSRWHARAAPAAPLNIATEWQRLTYEIVSQTIFSGALDAHRAAMHASMALYFETLGRIDLGSLINLPSWWPSLAERRGRPALRIFRRIAERAVQDRAAAATKPGDLLDRLMEGHSTENDPAFARVADNLLTVLAAGHETTANALAWIVYLLALFPEAEARVLTELNAPAGADPFAGLAFTRAVVNEALRLYPPAALIGRQAVGADLLGGYEVTPGMQIIIAPWILHRHRQLWRNPDDFVPERFLAQPEDTLPRGQFIPFGLGPRICIGQGFAMQEILLVLKTVLPAFQLRLVPGQNVMPQARITLYPRGGLQMVVTERK